MMESSVGVALKFVIIVGVAMIMVGNLANDPNFNLPPQLQWGMSWEDVREFQGDQLLVNKLLEEGDQYLVYGLQLSKEKVLVYYQFEDNRLVAVKYGFFFGTPFGKVEKVLEKQGMELSYSGHPDVTIREQNNRSAYSAMPSFRNSDRQKMPFYEVDVQQVPQHSIWESAISVVHHYQKVDETMHVVIYMDREYEQQLIEELDLTMMLPFDELQILQELQEKYDRNDF